MSLLEYFDNKPSRPPIQIFATDISEPTSLDKARAGIYPDSIEAEVSPERLSTFFSKGGACLPNRQIAARPVRLCAPELDLGPALFPCRYRQLLPQRVDLSVAAAAKAGFADVSLLPQLARLSRARQLPNRSATTSIYSR